MDIEKAVEKENKDDIERILRIYECDENFSVDAIQCQPGSREGDNYMSVVKRIIVRGRFSNDKGMFSRTIASGLIEWGTSAHSPSGWHFL